ncbi:MAG: hypothetical protein RQ756_03780 [Flavobacteriaceae bacterium]|nr:hypothetical protein [Flavobacteriaceae bacterium]
MYAKYLEQFKTQFYAHAVLGILVSSCLGSIAAMLVLTKGTTLLCMSQLFIVTAVSMTYNGSVLAQIKPRYVFNLLILSVVVNVLVIALNLI